MKPIITFSQWVLNLAVGLLGIVLASSVIWFMFKSDAAIDRGDKVSLWPPSITPTEKNSEAFPETIRGDTIKQTAKKVSELVDELARLKEERGNIKNAEEKMLRMFPKTVQGNTIEQTAKNVGELVNKLARLEEGMRKIENIKRDFLVKITTFDNETQCYGNSLNFTYIPSDQDTASCKSKEELAKRFLGFLAEIEFYTGDIIESPKIAKDILTKYQESKSFGRTGWYSRDVLKWIVLDYLDKV